MPFARLRANGRRRTEGGGALDGREYLGRYAGQANGVRPAGAQGHCGAALADNKNATVVLIPGAPHTLLNLPAARHATEGFLRDLLGERVTASKPASSGRRRKAAAGV